MNELLKCPHCGKTIASVVEEEIFFHVECREEDGGCGAGGGKSHILSRAIDKWNTRKEDFAIGQTVWYIRRSGTGSRKYTVKEGKLIELGYTDRMELAGRVKGAGGRIGIVIFKTKEEATAEADRRNSDEDQTGLLL